MQKDAVTTVPENTDARSDHVLLRSRQKPWEDLAGQVPLVERVEQSDANDPQAPGKSQARPGPHLLLTCRFWDTVLVLEQEWSFSVEDSKRTA